jgi:hypothetical protein
MPAQDIQDSGSNLRKAKKLIWLRPRRESGLWFEVLVLIFVLMGIASFIVGMLSALGKA